MRFLMIVLLLSAALAAGAQSQSRPRPPGTTPLEEPPPPMVEPDPALQPQISVRKEGDQEITEYRVNGKLYMMRVTPKNGRPYVMMDHKGDGTFSKQDNTLAPHLVVPQWVLLEF